MADRRSRPLDDDSVPVDLFPADQTNRLDPVPEPLTESPDESDPDLLLPGVDELFPPGTLRTDPQPEPKFAFESQLAADPSLALPDLMPDVLPAPGVAAAPGIAPAEEEPPVVEASTV